MAAVIADMTNIRTAWAQPRCSTCMCAQLKYCSVNVSPQTIESLITLSQTLISKGLMWISHLAQSAAENEEVRQQLLVGGGVGRGVKGEFSCRDNLFWISIASRGGGRLAGQRGFLSISLETSLPDSAAVATIPLLTFWPQHWKKKLWHSAFWRAHPSHWLPCGGVRAVNFEREDSSGEPDWSVSCITCGIPAGERNFWL